MHEQPFHTSLPAEAGGIVPRAHAAEDGVDCPISGFNPVMLTAAREARYMTQSELAQKMGVSQPLVARWEMPCVPGGEAKRPGEAQVVKLAELLDYHPSVFFAPASGPLASQSEFYHRAFAKAKRADVKAAHARCSLIELQVDRLLKLCPPPEDRIPDIDPDNHAGDVERIAAWARARMDVPAGPVANLVKTVEACGGIVIDRDLHIENMDALCRWRHGLPKLFFLNGAKSADRTRLSLAHELGHTVMHFNRDVPLEVAEPQAQRFAAAFLLPAAEFRHDLGAKLDLPKLAALKRKWGVSMQAVAYRAHQLGCIDRVRYTSIFQQLSRNGWRKTEPVDVRPESPVTFKRLLLAHLGAGYTVEQLAETLYVTVKRVNEYLVDARSPDWEDAGVRMRLVR